MTLTLIKLGGSVITRDARPAFNHDNILRLGRELAGRNARVVLVHGTGHVGKPWAIAHDYVASGYIPPGEDDLARRVRSALTGLNHDVTDCLRKAGIDAIACESGVHFTPDLRVRDPDGLRARLLDHLDRGETPVLHGDHVTTQDGGNRVLSSDVIMACLGALLKPETVLFLSDVDGVLGRSADSDRPGPLLSRLSPGMVDQVWRDPDDRQDVSGAMPAKLEHAFALAGHASRCAIANGLCPGVLAAMLDGRPAPCTEVVADGITG